MTRDADISDRECDRPLILVAEDVGFQVRLIQICLEREGYRIQAARDGHEALVRIAEESPDLILLDIDMPRMNGFQVLDRLRAQPETCAIPVIVLTAHAKDSGLFAEWATPTDVFLTKPFSPTELVRTIEKVLRASNS
jgi:CheY-like chemotaxis protein